MVVMGIRLVVAVPLAVPLGATLIPVLTTTLGGFNFEIFIPFAGLDDFKAVVVVGGGIIDDTILAISFLFSLVDDCDVDEDDEAELSRPVVDGMLDVIHGIDVIVFDRVF